MHLYFNLSRIQELLEGKSNTTDEAVVRSILVNALGEMGYKPSDDEVHPLVKTSHHEALDLVNEYLEEKLNATLKNKRVNLVAITPYYYKAIFY